MQPEQGEATETAGVKAMELPLPTASERENVGGDGDIGEEGVSGDTASLEQAVLDFAQQFQVAPAKLTIKKDAATMLELMQKGVIVSLHISRPRFVGKLTFELLGLRSSEKTQQVMRDYFSLGRHSLLPRDLQNRLATAEVCARDCLRRYSIKSHWGAFVPQTNWDGWQEENARHEAHFWAIKEELMSDFDQVMQQVLEDYRPVAEEVWRRVRAGDLVIQEDISEELSQAMLSALRSQQGKTAFIEAYLAAIRQEMLLKKAELADAFAYETEFSFIPLPSLLARDVQEAGRLAREKALSDAQVQADLAVIHQREQTERERIWQQQRLEQERLAAQAWEDQQERRLAEQRLAAQHRAEMDQLEQEQRMKRAVVQKAQQQKERLIDGFFRDIMGQINQAIVEACESASGSIEQNGHLTGGISRRLRNLVETLRGFNFMADDAIEQQIAALEAVLPDPEAAKHATEEDHRLATLRVQQVVSRMRDEAQSVLLELGMRPQGLRQQRTETESLIPMVGTPSSRGRRTSGLMVEGGAGEVSGPTREQRARKRRPAVKSDGGKASDIPLL